MSTPIKEIQAESIEGSEEKTNDRNEIAECNISMLEKVLLRPIFQKRAKTSQIQ